MILLAYIGGFMIAGGLFGLGFCIHKGFRIRRTGLPAEKVNAELHKLIAINLGSVGLAAFGLALLFLGLTF